MKFRIGNGLWVLLLLVILLVVAINVHLPSPVRIVLGLPFVLFLPGYVMTLALSPRKEAMGAVERVALSFGLSIVAVSFIGLALNYTPWGIALNPILYSVSLFILACSVIAWLRQARLPAEERFGIVTGFKWSGWGGSALDKFLSVILVLAVLGAFGVIGRALLPRLSPGRISPNLPFLGLKVCWTTTPGNLPWGKRET